MKPSRWLIVFGIGILLMVVGGALVGLQFASLFSGTDHDIPSTFTIELDEGTQVVYQEVLSGSARFGATDVSVEDPSGDTLTVGPVTGSQTLMINGRDFVGVADFDVTESGVHTIEVNSSGPGVVRIAPDIFGQVGLIIAWVGIVGLGLIMAALGLIMFFVSRKRRRRAEQESQFPQPPPGQPTYQQPQYQQPAQQPAVQHPPQPYQPPVQPPAQPPYQQPPQPYQPPVQPPPYQQPPPNDGGQPPPAPPQF